MEFLEHEYWILAKIIPKTRKITIPKKIGNVGQTVFIIIKRPDFET